MAVVGASEADFSVKTGGERNDQDAFKSEAVGVIVHFRPDGPMERLGRAAI